MTDKNIFTTARDDLPERLKMCKLNEFKDLSQTPAEYDYEKLLETKNKSSWWKWIIF